MRENWRKYMFLKEMDASGSRMVGRGAQRRTTSAPAPARCLARPVPRPCLPASRLWRPTHAPATRPCSPLSAPTPLSQGVGMGARGKTWSQRQKYSVFVFEKYGTEYTKFRCTAYQKCGTLYL
jgi:hypothetical protein